MIFQSSIDEYKNIIDKLPTIEKEVLLFFEVLLKTLEDKKKVYIFGNGGSASDAQHFAAELVGRFEKERNGYPVIALNTDSSTLTAISNDYGFEMVFAKQVDSICESGDLLIGITTSGNSKNIINAFSLAKKKSVSTIALTGNKGGEIKKFADLSVIVPSSRTCRIQECHIFILHFICELLDQKLKL